MKFNFVSAGAVVFTIFAITSCTGVGTQEDVTHTIPEGYNRLANEQSPYLLQHATNPVDWYPWGEEAFEAARKQDKPIFLSVGYSTCHWCHVMEHESFEDDEVAALMNETVIAIKVDREERPDIDGIYMTVAQILTGRGGWPLTIIMTPEKLPFFAGTYIPKNTRGSMMGMMDLIPRIDELWQNERDRIDTSADQITAALNRAVGGGEPGGAPTRLLADSAFNALLDSFDSDHGGFGSAPKFPSPHNLLFLLRYAHATGDARGTEMAVTTLKAMRRGGMYDHIGFGFHRYSTDQEWLVPHFEKMLYDQALLTYAYTEAFSATGEVEFRRTASEIIEYVIRDMTGPEGGFYSAEDADSEGEEGKFYLWSIDELQSVLKDDAPMVTEYYGVTNDGNYRDEATGGLTGLNILHTGNRTAPPAFSEISESARRALFEQRERRIRPGLDDKVLTDWNGLMIAALAKAGVLFEEPRYTDAAKNAADFLWNTMMLDDRRLLHRYRNGEAAITGTFDDYSFFIWGLIELYDATFDPLYIERAQVLIQTSIEDFWDETDGGFFFTSDSGEVLIAREKDSYDSAIPAGNSVMAHNLERFSRLTGDTDLTDLLDTLGKAFSTEMKRVPSAHSLMVSVPTFLQTVQREVIVVGVPGAEDTSAFIAAYRSQYVPGAVLLVKDPADSELLNRLAPYSSYYDVVDGKAAAYVCTNFVCELPTTEPQEMISLLQGDIADLETGR